MRVQLSLFGAFRAMQAKPALELDVKDGADVAALREALAVHATKAWPNFNPTLLAASVFATESMVLREREALPDDGRVAILPPVSGG